MTSERVQRQIDRLLDEAESALGSGDWATVRLRAEAVLRLDSGNGDARAYLTAATRDSSVLDESAAGPSATASSAQPSSFANGRYVVRRFLGEGGRKKVYLAHDAALDRDVAFALIETEGLDAGARERITREAQAMGRLGTHPNIVTVFDIGEEQGQPFLVLPVMSGGDVEGVVEKAPEHKLLIDQVLKIGIETCQGLEFVHGKGIVHRDLKPGNVWLSEDGRAMIGDFGLAVAMDRSRLTQAGMMVGTVSYMPPEQAMGGEITPRSDLYALGAMLYEMVCGRPPFVGDESVAIIGQHLNTPPVVPTWHRPDCPPALEALILRLLEKDPSKRPASASEVREALEAIGQPSSRTYAPTEPTSPHDHDPLYRRTFVGRENEVRQLQQAFDAGVSGNGALVMVVGEPGIGKTALCEQLATYVALRGGKALVGHCYEEGSLSLPYLAFVEAMRSYVLGRDPDALRSDLGSGAADVARIVSEVRDRVDVELRPAGDPEDDRWRLLQAVTSFLRNASSVQPLCIVLEDLHWADRGTLDLLLHVSRNLQGSRLLLVGTYRDVEVDRAHPLSGTLAELRRQGNFLRVPLRGLTVDEVHRMYEAIRGNSVSWAQAEAVHRQTEGNPLFIQEVIRYMVEEGFVVREGGRWVPAEGTQPGTGLPEGLRDVVGKRLSRLSPECNRLLSVAAVIGRDFDLQTLRSVAGLSEDDLLAGIEEAVRVGVLEERSLPGAVRYRFAHAFFRTSLYEEMIAPRRLRLHQEVARALEAQYASRREEHAAELAEHYGQSTDRADLAKAVEYSELAAKRATSVFAYAEAEGHLRRCLEVQEVLDPDDKARRYGLLLQLGQVKLSSGQSRGVVEEVAEEAFRLGVALSDPHAASMACRLATRALGQMSLEAAPFHKKWAERAKESAVEGTIDQVYAYFQQALYARLTLTDWVTAREYMQRALSIALKLGDAAAVAEAAGPILIGVDVPPEKHAERQRVAAEISDIDFTGVSPVLTHMLFWGLGETVLTWGDRPAAEAIWERVREHSERTHDAQIALRPLALEAFAHTLNGEFEQALAMREPILAKAEERGTPAAGVQAAGQSTRRALIYLGRADEALENMPPAARLPIYVTQRALCLAHLGRQEEAKRLLAEFLQDKDIGNQLDTTPVAQMRYVFEAAILPGDIELTSKILPRLIPLAGLLHTEANMSYCIGRLLGEASVLLQRNDEAK